MGLFFRPRRPLMRLAAGAGTAGIAYEAPPASPLPPAYVPVPAHAPSPAAAPPPDSIAELERLARLHESGALTDEEFTAAKARALGL
jgi:Short C-terminal domain